MKRLFLLAAVLSFSLLQLKAQQLTVATYNLRYDNLQDKGNLWKDRKAAVAALINFHDFDVFGIQEGLQNQLDDILSTLPQYVRYGKGRDDGKEGGEHSAIFYKKDKFKLLGSGDFWLSETPDKPGLGWDATCCNRICSWVYLYDLKSKKKFYFFNTHFDHQGKVARMESAKLMVQKIKQIAGNTDAILTGDFNGGRETEWYQSLANSGTLHDTYKDVKRPYENNGSFNNFGKGETGEGVIDHIFGTSRVSATKWGILTDTYHGKYTSDHFPVMAVISFRK
ncbi:MAG: endonuclease/exonuclease/phosphatase family protein [Niabella sp.]